VLFEWLGDLLSPPRCAACSAALGGPAVFCAPCAASVERFEVGPDAGAPLDAVAFGRYGGALARSIHRFKYEKSPYLARPLGALLRDVCRRTRVRADVVVPVPLHRRRLVERGYNQSALLAHHVARELGAPLVTRALERVVDTAPQVDLGRDARQSNVQRAFHTRCPPLVQDRIVALVDDVSTTGATMAACRNALINAGALEVTCVILARAEPPTVGNSS
jgi:ComF family protein